MLLLSRRLCRRTQPRQVLPDAARHVYSVHVDLHLGTCVSKQVWSGLTYNTVGYEEENKIKDREYSKEYGAFFMSGVVVFLAVVFSVFGVQPGNTAHLSLLSDINEFDNLGEPESSQNQLYSGLSRGHQPFRQRHRLEFKGHILPGIDSKRMDSSGPKGGLGEPQVQLVL